MNDFIHNLFVHKIKLMNSKSHSPQSPPSLSLSLFKLHSFNFPTASSRLFFRQQALPECTYGSWFHHADRYHHRRLVTDDRADRQARQAELVAAQLVTFAMHELINSSFSRGGGAPPVRGGGRSCGQPPRTCKLDRERLTAEGTITNKVQIYWDTCHMGN